MTKHYDVKCPYCNKDLTLISKSDGTWGFHVPSYCHFCDNWLDAKKLLEDIGVYAV